MDAIEIVDAYLKENDFDGLVNSDNECGCGLGDLVPCGENFSTCQPAIEVEVPAEKDFDYYYATKDWKETPRVKSYKDGN